jgi:hypothetical protein
MPTDLTQIVFVIPQRTGGICFSSLARQPHSRAAHEWGLEYLFESHFRWLASAPPLNKLDRIAIRIGNPGSAQRAVHKVMERGEKRRALSH